MSTKQLTLAELAKHLKVEFRGDPQCVIHGVAPLEKAQEGDISFFYDPRYRRALSTTKASVVILANKHIEDNRKNFIITETPRLIFAKTATLFQQTPDMTPGIHATAVIGQNCRIADSASVGANCVIGNNVSVGENTFIASGTVIGENSSLGSNCILWPNVTLYPNVQMGHRVIIHSGTVIGSDGFGFENEGGVWYKIPQLGGVIIGDEVEIGANTTIDRGALNNTVIGVGVKLDNLIQVGHNVVIGDHTVIAGCVAIAGGARIGKHCMIGGKVGIAGHLEIVDYVILTAGTTVSSSIVDQGIYSSGIPAHANRNWRKNAVRFMQLDDMARRLRKLEKNLNLE